MDSGEELTLILGIWFASLLGLSLVIGTYHKWRGKKNDAQYLKSLPTPDLKEIYKYQAIRENEYEELQASTTSFFNSTSDISSLTRYSIPFLIVINIGLFLVAHLYLGGTVNTDTWILTRLVRSREMNDITISEVIIKLWHDGLYFPSVFFFVTALLWPYVKLIALLIIWFLSPKTLSTEKRGNIIENIESFGKWSMADNYFLMIVIVIIRMTAQSPVNPRAFSLETVLIPSFGLYANVIAQIVSQVISNIVQQYHTKTVDCGIERIRQGREGGINNQEVLPALCKHNFVHISPKDKSASRVGTCGSVTVLILAIASIACVIVGSILPSFELERSLGVAGKLLELGELGSESIVETYSLIDLINAIINQASYLKTNLAYFGLGILYATIIATSILIPCTLSIALLSIWFFSMTTRVRKMMTSFVAILEAWQYIEVYILAAYIAMWRVGEISDVVLEDFCTGLAAVLSILNDPFASIADPSSQCFRVTALTLPGLYVLIAAAIFLDLLSRIVLSGEEQQQFNIDYARYYNLQSSNASADRGFWERINKNGGQNSEGQQDLIKNIGGPGFQFADKFSWFLIKFPNTSEQSDLELKGED